FVAAPEIERRIFACDRTEAPALAQQERLEVKLGYGVPEMAARLSAAADQFDVVIGGQPMRVVSDEHEGHLVRWSIEARAVMAGLVPAIHVFAEPKIQDMDARA